MRETSLHISRWIVCHCRIVWYALLLCSLSYCSAHAQPPTGPISDNNLEQTLELLATTLVVTVIVVIVFMFTVHCSNGTAGTNQWRLPGLEKAVIEAFPVLVYSAVKQIKIGQESSLECAICLGEFEDDETLRLLLPKCNHVFHPACIDMWLASHVTCPVCRANLRPESAANVTKHSTQQQAAREPNQHNSSALGQCNATLDDDIVITIDEEQNRDSQVTVMASTSQQRFFQPPRPAMPEKFPRSHSTGHSLEEYSERYTLRLPEDMMRQLISRTKLTRTRSFKVCSTREWSSSRGYKEDGGGGEDSSRGRQIGIGRSDVWVFSMTPPFVSRGGSVKS